MSTEDQDSSDDFCFYCTDGGVLICCDKCPKVFHTACVGLRVAPKGDWFCPECRRLDPSLPGFTPMSRGRGDVDISRSVVQLNQSDAEVDEIDGFQIYSFARPTGAPNASVTPVATPKEPTVSATSAASSPTGTDATLKTEAPSGPESNVIHIPCAPRPNKKAKSK